MARCNFINTTRGKNAGRNVAQAGDSKRNGDRRWSPSPLSRSFRGGKSSARRTLEVNIVRGRGIMARRLAVAGECDPACGAAEDAVRRKCHRSCGATARLNGGGK